MISGNILYSDENCGEPIAYLDEWGNFLAGYPLIKTKEVSALEPN